MTYGGNNLFVGRNDKFVCGKLLVGGTGMLVGKKDLFVAGKIYWMEEMISLFRRND